MNWQIGITKFRIKKRAVRTINRKLCESNFTEEGTSFDKNRVVRNQSRNIPGSISQPHSQISGDKRMPLQQAIARERKEANHQQEDKIPLHPQGGGVQAAGEKLGCRMCSFGFSSFLLSAQNSKTYNMQHSERRVSAINTPQFFHSRSHLVVGFCSCLTLRTPLCSQSSCAHLRSILLLGFLLYRLCSRCGRHPVSLIASLLASPFFIVLQLRKVDRHGTETD